MIVADFRRRMEFWMFSLFYAIISTILSLIDLTLTAGILTGIFQLVMVIPGLAVSVRRLHDINKSGWWVLIGLIPIVGFIVLLIFMIKEGDKGDNQYGSDPKAEETAE